MTSNWSLEAKRAYLAALIDGEGTIGIKRRLPTPANRMASPKYSVHVGVSMTDRAPIDFIASFCGSPQLVSSRVRHQGYKTIFEFAVENDRASWLLAEISPYLVGKVRQAELALQFAELRKRSRWERTKVVSVSTFQKGRAKGHSYRSMGLSDAFIAECDALYQSLLKGNPRSGQPGRFGSRP